MTLLQIQDLHVTFSQNKQAVRGVDLAIKQGQTLAIVGETGSGKSAIAKSITRLFPKNVAQIQGKILFQGKDLLSATDRELQAIRGKEIGMIFQDPLTSLNPTMKIGNQILEIVQRSQPGLSTSKAVSVVHELLKQVGIPDPEHRASDFPHTLSGGMRQRVMIAQALASAPKLLIADEPTTALDVTIQAQIFFLLKELQKKYDMSILLITHDLSLVAGFCDWVYVLYAGMVVESASVDDLFYNPKHPYTQGLLRSIPKIHLYPEEPLLPIAGSAPSGSFFPTGCAFHPRCPKKHQRCEETTPPLFFLQQNQCTRCWLEESP